MRLIEDDIKGWVEDRKLEGSISVDRYLAGYDLPLNSNVLLREIAIQLRKINSTMESYAGNGTSVVQMNTSGSEKTLHV